MGYKIYDNDGNEIGKMKSEKEVLEEAGQNFIETIGCLGAIICCVVGLFVIAPWVGGTILMIQNEEYTYLVVMIPIIIATILGRRKVMEASNNSLWGTFWRMLLINTGVGTPFCIPLVIFDMSYFDLAEAIFGAVLSSLIYAVFPAVIIAWIVNRRKRK